MKFDNVKMRIIRIEQKHYIGKVLVILLVIILFNTNIFVYADEIEDDENENIISEINREKEETVESGVTEKKNPTINSKRYAVYDRKSKTVIYGKDEKKQSAMASTTKIMTRNNSFRELQKLGRRSDNRDYSC